MIIKAYRPDGSPHLNRWQVTCDIRGCTRTAPLIGSRQWLIPANPHMPCYCPECFENLAADLINGELH